MYNLTILGDNHETTGLTLTDARNGALNAVKAGRQANIKRDGKAFEFYSSAGLILRPPF